MALKAKYRALVFDVDGVLVAVDSAWRYLHEGLGTWSAAKLHARLFRMGVIDYITWARLDVRLWRGVAYEVVSQLADLAPVVPGAFEVAKLAKTHGLKLIAISAGLDVLANKIGKLLGFDRVVANSLILKNGVLTGDVQVEVEYRNKGKVLADVCRELGIKPEECIAIGDSRVDLPMMEMAGFSIAYNPKDEEVERTAEVVIKSNTLYPLLEILKTLI